MLLLTKITHHIKHTLSLSHTHAPHSSRKSLWMGVWGPSPPFSISSKTIALSTTQRGRTDRRGKGQISPKKMIFFVHFTFSKQDRYWSGGICYTHLLREGRENGRKNISCNIHEMRLFLCVFHISLRFMFSNTLNYESRQVFIIWIIET